MRRYFVKVEVQVETDDERLIPVEIQGRLLDATTRPAGLRVDDAQVVAIHEQIEVQE